MCLAIPMKIIEIKGPQSRCYAKGVERQVSLFMMQDKQLKIGDYVMVHVGYAIQKVNEHEALSSWELYDQLADLDH
ncbi:MAG TPA: HypC/HybG/HupF family hydrogenase formation chaperone [Gammaproteobacteria bacterium]|nr:HypC/HybG/HupF family hydrogenase formation chaperone [Gammaproteobacteria bacterium]HDZ79184.1 HypC/HybG/HupF family hydrogenase formation chaperone [Gammaproteobacteria bacterium]